MSLKNEIEALRDKTFKPGEEQKFKTACIQLHERFGLTVFEVENEEKVAGFPDSIEFGRDVKIPGAADGWNFSRLVEYKVSDAKGMIEFQPKQPLFYKQHHDRLVILIRAYCVPDKKAYIFESEDVIEALVKNAKKATSAKSGLKVSIVGGKIK